MRRAVSCGQPHGTVCRCHPYACRAGRHAHALPGTGESAGGQRPGSGVTAAACRFPGRCGRGPWRAAATGPQGGCCQHGRRDDQQGARDHRHVAGGLLAVRQRAVRSRDEAVRGGRLGRLGRGLVPGRSGFRRFGAQGVPGRRRSFGGLRRHRRLGGRSLGGRWGGRRTGGHSWGAGGPRRGRCRPRGGGPGRFRGAVPVPRGEVHRGALRGVDRQRGPRAAVRAARVLLQAHIARVDRQVCPACRARCRGGRQRGAGRAEGASARLWRGGDRGCGCCGRCTGAARIPFGGEGGGAQRPDAGRRAECGADNESRRPCLPLCAATGPPVVAFPPAVALLHTPRMRGADGAQKASGR